MTIDLRQYISLVQDHQPVKIPLSQWDGVGHPTAGKTHVARYKREVGGGDIPVEVVVDKVEDGEIKLKKLGVPGFD